MHQDAIAMNGVCWMLHKVFDSVDSGAGKKGKDSAAAKYAAATPPDGFSIEEDKPYAEAGFFEHTLGVISDLVLSYGWALTHHYPRRMSRLAAPSWILCLTTRH